MRNDYLTNIGRLVQDDADKLTADDLDTALDAALERLGRARPRQVVEDVVAEGIVAVPLPAAWIEDVSALQAVEYPLDQPLPSLLPVAEFFVYRAPSSAQLRSTVARFTMGDTVRLTYTGAHVLTADASSVPTSLREGVECLAAARLLRQLAAFYAGSTDSTLQADTVQHITQSGEYLRLAKDYEGRYRDAIGQGAAGAATVAAGTVVDWNATDSRGRDRLTHPNRYR